MTKFVHQSKSVYSCHVGQISAINRKFAHHCKLSLCRSIEADKNYNDFDRFIGVHNGAFLHDGNRKYSPKLYHHHHQVIFINGSLIIVELEFFC